MTYSYADAIAWAYVLFGVIVIFWALCYLLQWWRARRKVQPEQAEQLDYHQTHLSLRREK